jgi:hypothetical protein
MKKTNLLKHIFPNMKNIFFTIALLFAFQLSFAQVKWGEGELEDVEIEIVKERQITLPKANRTFEKIPPKPSEPIKAPMKYDFRPFSFQTSQFTPQIRPLKLKQEESSKVTGGYVSVGYGNYASPYLEGFINTKKDKNKLVGAHAFLNSSDKGPVDGVNSGGGMAGVSVFGKSFTDYVSLSAEAEFENRSTHFYGYTPGLDVDGATIKQAYNNFRLAGELSNTKKSDFSYKLGGAFGYMMDKYDAKETEVDLAFGARYNLDDESNIGVDADYVLLNRADIGVDIQPRSLFSVRPYYTFYPVADLKLTAGIVAAFENDSIDDRDVHAYPDLRASYPLSPSVDVVAALTGGIEKVSLQSLSRENLWIAPNIAIFHTNKLYDLQAALHTRIGSKVGLNGGFSFAALKNLYFYVNDPADQAKFIVEYDQDATIRTNVFASIGFAQTESVKILVRGDLFNYSTQEQEEAWHRPTYKLTGDVSFNIYKKLLFDVNLIAQGGMKAKDYTSGTDYTVVDVDPAFDLNARLEYLVSPKFSVFVKGNNLTSNEYPVFLNYPVRGLQVTGGLTWTF